MVRCEVAARGEQFWSFLAVKLEVFGEGGRSFIDESSSLVEGQGKTAEFPRDLFRQVAVRIGGGDVGTAQQEECCFLQVHFLDFDALGYWLGGLGAGGEEDVAFGGLREEIAGDGEVVGVVEDQEPAGVVFEPALGGGGCCLLVGGGGFGEIQMAGDGGETGDQRLAGLRAGPEDCRVVGAMEVGEFDGGLCFADASYAAEGCCAGLLERFLESGQDLFAAGEECVRDVPGREEGLLAGEWARGLLAEWRGFD